MPDQANPLRRMMLATAAEQGLPPGRRPRLGVVAGGKPGVGTTTLALNLAVAMAQRGVRAVLVDGNARDGDLATMCRLDRAHSLADVLAGRLTVAESLRPGPGGIHVLAGMWALERVSDYPPDACDSVVGQFAALTDVADWILLDAGHASSPMATRMGRAADLILLVTTPDDDAVMDTYTAIKMLWNRGPSAVPATLVNALPRAANGDEVHGRLARACRRFLGFEPAAVGCVESDRQIRCAAARGDPFVLAMPTSTAARQVYRAASNLCSLPSPLRRAG